MCTNEIIEKYKEKICPKCVHYVDKDYDECNITMNIDHEANCINYKCTEFCKKKVPYEELKNVEQGFLTENGKFVDRKLAVEIAKHFNQIKVKHPPEDELYSEDYLER